MRHVLAVLSTASVLAGGAASFVLSDAHAANERLTRVKGVTVHRCRDVGPPQTDVGLNYVRAVNTNCGRALTVLRHWYYDRNAPDSGPIGWKCLQSARAS